MSIVIDSVRVLRQCNTSRFLRYIPDQMSLKFLSFGVQRKVLEKSKVNLDLFFSLIVLFEDGKWIRKDRGTTLTLHYLLRSTVLFIK